MRKTLLAALSLAALAVAALPALVLADSTPNAAAFNVDNLPNVTVGTAPYSFQPGLAGNANGICLSGAASGAAPSITPCNPTGTPDANAGLTVAARGTGNLQLGQGSSTVGVGPGGSALTNGIVVYSASLTPTATAAAIQTVEQTFNPAGFAGLSTSDKVYVNGPAPTSLCPPTTVRVSATGTLAIGFTTLTAVACTPAAGTYLVIAIR